MKAISFAAAVLVCLTSSGQFTWQRTYGGYSTEEGNSVITTADGGYLVVGSTGSFGAGSGDIYILKVQQDGVREWSRTLGGAGVEQGRQVKQTSDGGFAVVGFTNSSGFGGYDGYLAKLDVDGWPVWERTFGGEGWDFLHSVVECPDGGLMATGQTYSSGSGGGDAWMVKVDATGELEWAKDYGGAGPDQTCSLVHCSTGGYLLAGSTVIGGDENAWIIRTNEQGDTLWTSVQGGDSLDRANSVIETLDGGFVAVGTTRSFHPFTEAYHFKVDFSGALQWEWSWGTSHDQESLDVKELPDGGFISTGYIVGGSGGKDMYIYFTQPNGDYSRGVSNGGDNGDGDEVGYSVALTPDGGSIHCGTTTSFGYGPQDIYLVKTNDTGWTASVQVDPVFDPLSTVDRLPVPRPSVFPNPTTTACHITSRVRLHGAFLLDAQGRSVREWAGSVPQELDLRGLNAGAYQLVTIGEGNTRSAQPLIIVAY